MTDWRCQTARFGYGTTSNPITAIYPNTTTAVATYNAATDVMGITDSNAAESFWVFGYGRNGIGRSTMRAMEEGGGDTMDTIVDDLRVTDGEAYDLYVGRMWKATPVVRAADGDAVASAWDTYPLDTVHAGLQIDDVRLWSGRIMYLGLPWDDARHYLRALREAGGGGMLGERVPGTQEDAQRSARWTRQ